MRTCGDCQLCCKLLPVRAPDVGVNKGANERCKHQSHARGCKVYSSREMPACCSLWSCRWLVQPEETAVLSRPDRSHYVLDIVPDFVTTIDHETGERRHAEIIQVWVDPRFPDAHRDPALRDYLARLAQTKGVAALIRYSSDESFALVAPVLSGQSDWLEIEGEQSGETHSARQVVDALGGSLDITIKVE